MSRGEINCLAVVQARMGSTRLPGKVLTDIAGRPALWHVIRRLEQCPGVDRVMAAIPEGPEDDALADYAAELGVDCFRGDQDDVLDRIFQAAAPLFPRAVARVTADCPLLDPYLLDFILGVFWEHGFDYASNCLQPTFPDGLDLEVMTMAALERTWREASRPAQREHVTPYIRTNPGRFRLANVHQARDLSSLCWALDAPQDLEFLRAVYARLDPADPGDYGFERVLEILRAHPETAAINGGSVRDHKLVEEIPEIFSANQNGTPSFLWEDGS